jgi:peptidyl-prolyl cis-trans isomerase D
MLQEMRKFTKHWISSLFLGALALAFVVWGINFGALGSLGGSTTTLVKVGSTGIEQNDFKRDYDNYLRLEGERLGRTITPQEALKDRLGEQLLQQEIGRTALDNAASSLGLTASDQTVAARIQSVPQFAGITGTFDHDTFVSVISRMNFSEKDFIETERRDTTRDELIFAAEGNFVLPLGYGRALFAAFAELRAADYVMVTAKALPPIAPPPDAVLEAYVNANAAHFSTPEYRDVTYAVLTPQDVTASLNVSDAQIRNAYDDNKDHFVVPEKRQLEQMSFQNEADAKAAEAKIGAGTSFEAVAASRGLKPTDIDIGDLTQADLTDARSAAFALPEGGTTAPLKTDFGWVLLHVVKITKGQTTTLEQAHDQIKQALLQELVKAKLGDVSNAYTDASSGGLSLVKAAQKVGMRVVHLPAVDANGLGPDGRKVDAPDDPEFRAQVAGAEIGEEGDPVLSNAGNLFVVLVNGETPPKVKPLDAVRADALAGWTALQRGILLQKRAAELADEANRDKSLDAVAKNLATTVQASPALNRNTSDDTFSPELTAALFKALPGQAVTGPLGKGEGFVVARVTGIVHPVPPPSDLNFAGAIRELSGNAGGDITELLAAAMKTRLGVKYTSGYSKLYSDVVGGEGS